MAVGWGATWPALSSLRRPSTQAQTLFGGARFITWRLRRPFCGECRQGPRHFWSRRTSLSYGPTPGTTWKRPYATIVRLVGRTTNTDFLPALGWDISRSAVLVGTRIWPGFFWFQWQSVEVRLDRHPRASESHTPVSWRPFLGEYPAHGPTWKRPCVTLVLSVGRTTNTDFLLAVEPGSFKRTLLPTVLTLLFCIYVLFIQYTCSTYFSSSVSSYWPKTRHNNLAIKDLRRPIKKVLY